MSGDVLENDPIPAFNVTTLDGDEESVETPTAGKKKTPKTEKPAPPYRKGQFVKPLSNMYATIGTLLVPFDETCGTAIIEAADGCANSLDQLAQKNVAVRRVLATMTETSAWAGVIIAHAPIVMAIASHHMLPSNESSDDEVVDGELVDDDVIRVPFRM